MAELFTQLQNDLKTAMKAKDTVRLSVVRLLISEMKKNLIDQQKDDLGLDAEVAVVRKATKSRKDSIDQAQKVGRQDVVDAETKELQILETYLPQQLTGAALLAKVREVAQQIGFAGPKDLGRFMKEWMAKHKSLADGKDVQDALKQL